MGVVRPSPAQGRSRRVVRPGVSVRPRPPKGGPRDVLQIRGHHPVAGLALLYGAVSRVACDVLRVVDRQLARPQASPYPGRLAVPRLAPLRLSTQLRPISRPFAAPPHSASRMRVGASPWHNGTSVSGSPVRRRLPAREAPGSCSRLQWSVPIVGRQRRVTHSSALCRAAHSTLSTGRRARPGNKPLKAGIPPRRVRAAGRSAWSGPRTGPGTSNDPRRRPL